MILTNILLAVLIVLFLYGLMVQYWGYLKLLEIAELLQRLPVDIERRLTRIDFLLQRLPVPDREK